jgi:hypothetical protein
MKTYAAILLGVAAAVVLCFIAASVIIDPYSVAHPLLGTYYFEPNSRVAKVDFLLRNCARYDSYFVGDSRSQTLGGGDLGLLKGRQFYNLATPADNILSIAKRLKFLLENGCKISTVIVNDSIDVLLNDDPKVARSLRQSESPAVSGENRIGFYSRYFLSAPTLSSYYRTRGLHAIPRETFHADGSVEYLWGFKDEAAFAEKCKAVELKVSALKQLPEKLPGYRQLAILAGQYHFDVVVWVVPLTKVRSSILGDPSVLDYLKQLRAIQNITVIQSDPDAAILSDYRAWHDCGHFRPMVFDRLFAASISEILQP